MYRNQYDTDCITWSPQGRIFQIEYAMEGVKQGTCVVGLRSSTHVVLCALKRTLSKLATSNKKMMKIDYHIGITWSGITADAKVVANFMRMECLNHKYVYDSMLPVHRLVNEVADKSQIKTQRVSKRPFCVGILVAGYDSTGPHLFETCPSGNFNEYYAMAIGRRSQASKTYLEKHFADFPNMNLKTLTTHAVNALNASVPQDLELSVDNVAIGVVGKDLEWHEMTPMEIQPFLQGLESPEQTGDDGEDEQRDATMTIPSPDTDVQGGEPQSGMEIEESS